MQLRDLLDRCAGDVMMSIYIPGESNPLLEITGTVYAIKNMVSSTILDYQVDELDIDDNTLEIRLMEDDCYDL